MMRVPVELSKVSDIQRFTELVKTVDEDVRLTGKDENGHVSDITILGFVVIFALLIINAGYGGGFSTLPALLSERFGMENISAIHGIALTAWAAAGITGNNTAGLILSNGGGYDTILLVCCIMYIVAWGISSLVVKSKPRKGEAFAG